MLTYSQSSIKNIDPEKFAKNVFEYNRFLRPNEIELVNRKIGKSSEKRNKMFGREENTINDLRSFFIKSSQEMKELQLNYFLVKKWSATDVKKNSETRVHIYLSIDYFYSIYEEKTDNKGNIHKIFKTAFHAENSDIVVKEIQKMIELSFIEKKLLWNSSKKIKLVFEEQDLQSFILHHDNAKSVFGKKNLKKDKVDVKVYQSSINFSNKKTSKSNMIGNVKNGKEQIVETKEFKEDEDYDRKDLELNDFQSNRELNNNSLDDNHLEMGDNQKLYLSEKVINSNDFGDSLDQKELDYDLINQIKQEKHMFKKKKDSDNDDGDV